MLVREGEWCLFFVFLFFLFFFVFFVFFVFLFFLFFCFLKTRNSLFFPSSFSSFTNQQINKSNHNTDLLTVTQSSSFPSTPTTDLPLLMVIVRGTAIIFLIYFGMKFHPLVNNKILLRHHSIYCQRCSQKYMP